MIKKVLKFGLLALLCPLACESDPDALPTQHCGINQDEARHICIHGTAGPFANLDTRLDQPVALVTALHTLYTLNLSPSVEGTFSGHFRFRSHRPGLWALFFSTDVVIDGQHASGTTLSVELSTHSTSCESLAVAHVLRLGRDETVTLTVSNARTPTLGFLPERLGETWSEALETQSCSFGRADAEVDAFAINVAPALDAGVWQEAAMDAVGGLSEVQPQTPTGDAAIGVLPLCLAEGPCSRDEECCDYCHDDHCH